MQAPVNKGSTSTMIVPGYTSMLAGTSGKGYLIGVDLFAWPAPSESQTAQADQAGHHISGTCMRTDVPWIPGCSPNIFQSSLKRFHKRRMVWPMD
jgi:hypothetical protein